MSDALVRLRGGGGRRATPDAAHGRSAAAVLLAACCSPGRVERLLAGLPAQPDAALEAAVGHARSLGVPDEAVLAVLHEDAGVPVAVAATLLGVDVRDGNGWLDDPSSLRPGLVPRPRSNGARTLLRAIAWTLVLVLVLAGGIAWVADRGAVLPCGEELCVDGLAVLLVDDTAVPGEPGAVAATGGEVTRHGPRDVLGIRVEHRGRTAVEAVLVWRHEDGELLVRQLVLDGARTTDVLRDGDDLPVGVHVVELRVDDGVRASTTFLVERGVGLGLD